MILVIDNYDSFTYNLVQYLGELGETIEVYRNDQIDTPGIAARRPHAILISPGPCTPKEARVSNDVLQALSARIPTVGVCLGHQCICDVFGGDVILAPREVHGKTTPIHHDGRTIFAGVPQDFTATRYHSLIVKEETLPSSLEISARNPEGIIMAVRHRSLPIEGVQFHPESILTEHGKTLLRNFLDLAAAWHREGRWGAPVVENEGAR
ncbi:MAG: aminodeoxychorismate/anthranilate synthase component II [Armatimonadetes bacterium]|nr:aminodeoxychorismate/anthranilate synthase component II [Armatimonadota bacterium]